MRRALVLLFLLPAVAVAGPPDIAGPWTPVPATTKEKGPAFADGCFRTPTFAELTVDGETVSMSWTFGEMLSGAETDFDSGQNETAKGRWKKDTLTLKGERTWWYGEYGAKPTETGSDEVRYELSYDKKSEHLVGTRNDKPYRLARVKKRTEPMECGDPPA